MTSSARPSEASGQAVPQSSVPEPAQRPERGIVNAILPDELIRLAPQLTPFLARPTPSWPEVIDAADWLRHHLGVSKPLWDDAWFTMGRHLAAIALAIVSTKGPDHFWTSPWVSSTAWCRKPRPGNCLWGGQYGRCDGLHSRYKRREAGRRGKCDRTLSRTALRRSRPCPYRKHHPAPIWTRRTSEPTNHILIPKARQRLFCFRQRHLESTVSMFSHPEYDGHQALLFAHNTASGLRALIAIHDTSLGPAFGGCRMYPYASEHQAMADVLRLSRGMTYKSAICELPYGGGKSVIIADPSRDKTPALLHAMGRLVEDLGGRYIIADDVGTTLADMVVMREVTRHTAAATPAAQQALPATAFGVFSALGAAAEVCLGRKDLAGLRVAVQGLGNVGMPLSGYLAAAGAVLVVSDLDLARCEQAAVAYGATIVAPEAIFSAPADLFAPAALGAVLNDATIPHLRCRIICGGANNQLAEARHDAALAARGIVFVPDYLANAGGVIDFHQETIDDRPEAVLASVARIGMITREVLRHAAETGATPLSVADAIVRARIRRVGGATQS
jgi:leucine dehydrogenase